jgi:hypothetical protein
MPVFPKFRRLRQQDCKFEASLVYIVRLYLKTPIEKNKGGWETQIQSMWLVLRRPVGKVNVMVTCLAEEELEPQDLSTNRWLPDMRGSQKASCGNVPWR